MIRPLRRRHLRLMAGLAVIGPVLFSLGLWARPGRPVSDDLPSVIKEPEITGAVDTLRIGDAWFALTSGVYPQTDEPGLRLVPIRDSLTGRPADVVHGPDVLLYWSVEAAGEALPADAWLLGPLRGVRPVQFRIPGALRGADGYLVVYSLGHRRLLGSVPFSLPPGGD